MRLQGDRTRESAIYEAISPEFGKPVDERGRYLNLPTGRLAALNTLAASGFAERVRQLDSPMSH